MKIKLILQHDIQDCGAACLAMVSAGFGYDLSVVRARELTKTDSEGTNLYGIVDGAQKIGLEAEGLNGTLKDLTDGLKKGEFSFPFVAHIVSDQGLLHYIVVYDLKDEEFYVADPGKGKYKLPLKEFSEQWSGCIAVFSKGKNFKTSHAKSVPLLKFFELLEGRKMQLFHIFALSLIVSGIGMAGAFVFQIMINYCLGKSDLPVMVSVSTVFIAVILLYLLAGLMRYVRGILILDVSKKIDSRLVLTYCRKLTGLPMESFAIRQTGDYISRYSDTEVIRSAVSEATVTLFLDTLMVLACGIILWLQNHLLFLLSLAVAAVYGVILSMFLKPVERANRRMMEDNALVQSYFKEMADGLPTIKAACAEDAALSKYEKYYTRFLKRAVEGSRLSMLQETLADTVELTGTALLLWCGFVLVQSNAITLGSLITFYALLAYFISPIKNLVSLQPTVQKAFIAADRLNDIMELKAEEPGSAQKMAPVNCWQLKDVNFRYGNRELTLENVSLSVRRGQRVALVGESGSGKTTIAKLFLRFYEPETGNVYLDDRPAEAFDLHELRNSIAYIEQNTFLFADTIRNNLLLGNPGVSEEDFMKVCRLMRVDDFVRDLPLKYDTPLTENGSNLSGGQRQRLAIARALLKKPQLMIMDEATSNLDTITEAAINDAIFSFDQEITILIIAHRLSTIRKCDHIYVLEHGKIAEHGTHEELYDRNGLYKQLWNKQ